MHLEDVVGLERPRLLPLERSPRLADHVENMQDPLVHSIPRETRVRSLESDPVLIEARLMHGRETGPLFDSLLGELRTPLVAFQDFHIDYVPVNWPALYTGVEIRA